MLPVAYGNFFHALLSPGGIKAGSYTMHAYVHVRTCVQVQLRLRSADLAGDSTPFALLERKGYIWKETELEKEREGEETYEYVAIHFVLRES